MLNKLKRGKILVLLFVCVGLFASLFSHNTVEAQYNGTSIGSCSIKFYENGNFSGSPITTNPQVNHTYGISAESPTVGGTTVNPNSGYTASKFAAYVNQGAEIPIGAGTFVAASGSSPYKWNSSGTFKISWPADVNSTHTTIAVVFKATNGNENDICFVNFSPEANTDGTPTGQNRCCANNNDCLSLGSGSTCGGSGGVDLTCRTGNNCVGGTSVPNGGSCDVTTKTNNCQNVNSGIKCFPNPLTATTGSCLPACSTLNTPAAVLNCLQARYPNLADFSQLQNKEDSCTYDAAHFITAVEPFYTDTVGSCQADQCGASIDENMRESNGTINLTMLLCFGNVSKCNSGSGSQCSITPGVYSAGGHSVPITVDTSCLSTGTAYKVNVLAGQPIDSPKIYASTTLTPDANPTQSLTVTGVSPDSGNNQVGITVVDSQTGKFLCQYSDTSYFASSNNNNGGSNGGTTTQPNSTEFGSQNCPYPSTVPARPAGVSDQVWASIQASYEHRTPDQVTENTQCTTCIGAGNTWTAIGCVSTSVSGVFTTLVRIALGVMGGVVLLRLIYLGYIYQTGDTGKIKEARAGVVSTIAGIVVVIFSIVILRVIGVNILNIVPPNFFGVG